MAKIIVKKYYKSKQDFTDKFIYALGMNEEAKNFAKNLKKLMDYHKDTQVSLSKRSTVSQKTISNMLNPDDDKSPNLENVSLVAKAYNLQTWHMLLPNAPLEILTNSSIEKFFDNYVNSDREMREAWARVAEASAKYSKIGNGR